MPKELMGKILSAIFILFYSTVAIAADYDAFIMNFLRVSPGHDKLVVQAALDVPKDLSFFKESLKKGSILQFSIEAELNQNRKFLHSKEVANYHKAFYIQYDPLTKQYVILDEHKPIIINHDPVYLLNTFVQNIQFEMNVELEKERDYELIIDVAILQINGKPWAEKNLFFVSKEIIQPASFYYEFTY